MCLCLSAVAVLRAVDLLKGCLNLLIDGHLGPLHDRAELCRVVKVVLVLGDDDVC